MHLIDWLGVIIPLIAVFSIAFYTKRFVKGVADFLAGGRAAGRYLLANARGASDAGLTNALARFEMVLISGLVLNFWDLVSMPVILLVGISGFVIYRFRETRALTMAQFLETRYSQAYRIYMGALAFVSGILNYGVFPAIASRFFVFFLDLPLTVAGIPTHILIMAVYLTVALIILLVGGQVTLMVADCVEGIFSHLVYMILVIVVFMLIRWDQMVEVLAKFRQVLGIR
jgi:SSS family solute:Na+ symporter